MFYQKVFKLLKVNAASEPEGQCNTRIVIDRQNIQMILVIDTYWNGDGTHIWDSANYSKM